MTKQKKRQLSKGERAQLTNQIIANLDSGPYHQSNRWSNIEHALQSITIDEPASMYAKRTLSDDERHDICKVFLDTLDTVRVSIADRSNVYAVANGLLKNVTLDEPAQPSSKPARVADLTFNMTLNVDSIDQAIENIQRLSRAFETANDFEQQMRTVDEIMHDVDENPIT